jgi:hypothetical protein
MPDPIRSPSTNDTRGTGVALEAYARTAPVDAHLGLTPAQINARTGGAGRPLAEVLATARTTYGIPERGLNNVPGELFSDSRIRINQYLQPLQSIPERFNVTGARASDPAAWLEAARGASNERNAVMERTRELISEKGAGTSRTVKAEPPPFDKLWGKAADALKKENPVAFEAMSESQRSIEVSKRVIQGAAKSDPTFNALVKGVDDAALGMKALKYGGRALMVVGAAVDGASIVSEARTSMQTGDWNNTGRQTAKVAGGWLGAAAAGAAVGTVSGTIVPGLGNVAGFVIGAAAGAVGYWLGSQAGEAGYNAVAGGPNPAPAH